jgi:small subunit ribosomal protein S8
MDTIGDFLTRIRNAGMAQQEKVDIPSSKMREGVAGVLRDSGYIRDFRIVKDGKQGVMRIYLKYGKDGKHVISSIRRVSRPGLRKYVSVDRVPEVRSGLGMAILSTSKGILGSKSAKSQNIGGEILCTLW